MRKPRAIQADIDALEAKGQTLYEELEALEAIDEPTPGQIARASRTMNASENNINELTALREELGRAKADEERRREAVRAKAFDGRNVESGDGATPSRYLGGRGPDVVQRNNIRPWGVNGDYPSHGAELVRHAQAAVEQVTEDYDHEINRARYLRKLETAGGNNQDRDLTAQWVLASSDPLYRSAFEKILTNPTHGLQLLDHDEVRAFQRAELARAALSLTDANGGYLIPFTLDANVVLTNAGIIDPIRQIATIKTIATDTWNGVTSAGVQAEWLGESAEAADATPTFGQPTITPKKAAAWVYGSYEVLADSGFANELSMLLADAKARLEGAAFATGNSGATRPRGIVAAVAAVTASIVTAAATNTFAIGDVYNTADALRPRDASEASWIANKKIYSLVRRFDTSGGGSFWANLGMGRPRMLLDQPAYECSTMTGAVATSANVLLAGNFKQYYVVDRVGMSIMYEPMVKSTGNGRPTGQAGWFSFFRVGADVVDPDAFRLLQLGTTATATALA